MRLTSATLEAAPAAASNIGTMLQATDSGLEYVSRVVDGTAQWLATTDPLAAGPLSEA